MNKSQTFTKPLVDVIMNKIKTEHFSSQVLLALGVSYRSLCIERTNLCNHTCLYFNLDKTHLLTFTEMNIRNF